MLLSSHCSLSLHRIHYYKLNSAKTPTPKGGAKRWCQITVTISLKEKCTEQVWTVRTVKYFVIEVWWSLGANNRAKYSVKVLRSIATNTAATERTVKYFVNKVGWSLETVTRARYSVKVLRSITTHTTHTTATERALFLEVLDTQHSTYNRSK